MTTRRSAVARGTSSRSFHAVQRILEAQSANHFDHSNGGEEPFQPEAKTKGSVLLCLRKCSFASKEVFLHAKGSIPFASMKYFFGTKEVFL